MTTYIDDLRMTIDTAKTYYYAYAESIDKRGDDNACSACGAGDLPIFETLEEARAAVEDAVKCLIECGELDTVDLDSYGAMITGYHFSEEEPSGYSHETFYADSVELYGEEEESNCYSYLNFARGSYDYTTFISYEWINPEAPQHDSEATKEVEEALREAVLEYWRADFCGRTESSRKRENPFTWISEEVAGFLEFLSMIDSVEIDAGAYLADGRELVEILFDCDLSAVDALEALF